MRQFHFTTKATQPIQRAHQPAPSLIPDKGKLIEMVNDFFGHTRLQGSKKEDRFIDGKTLHTADNDVLLGALDAMECPEVLVNMHGQKANYLVLSLTLSPCLSPCTRHCLLPLPTIIAFTTACNITITFILMIILTLDSYPHRNSPKKSGTNSSLSWKLVTREDMLTLDFFIRVITMWCSMGRNQGT